MNINEIRNVAVIGHSGEGKTTLCEAMLFNGGMIDRMGKVEDGTTVMDFDELEKAKDLISDDRRRKLRSKGNAVSAFLADYKEGKFDAIVSCGPPIMLKILKQELSSRNIKIPCFVSLEERMACGIGACLGCVCNSKEKDAHTNVNNKRICKEGPVFRAEEVEF